MRHAQDGPPAFVVNTGFRAEPLGRRDLGNAVSLLVEYVGADLNRVRVVEGIKDEEMTARVVWWNAVGWGLLPTLLGLGSVISAQELVTPKWAQGQSASPMSWPESFRGRVTDEADGPIPNADVTLSVNAQIWTFGGLYTKELYGAKTKSHENGQYSFSTADIPRFKHRPLSIEVTAKAKNRVAWRTWWWYGEGDKEAQPEFSTLKLKPGRQLKGVCVDPNLKPVPDAILHGYYSGSMRGAWGQARVTCDAQGVFDMRIPEDGHVGFWVYADAHGPNFFLVGDGQPKRLQFRLDDGAKVFGLARARDGSPIANAIVQAESLATGNLPAYSLPFKIAARTDARGKFRLPPLSGDYRIYLTSGSQHMVGGGHYESARLVPLTVPAKRTLGAGNRENLVIKESETAFVSGTVRWSDDTPAVGSNVRFAQMPEQNGTAFTLGRVLTDGEGKFRFRVPIPMERLLVYVESRERKGKGVRAFVAGPKRTEYAHFELSGDDVAFEFQFESPSDK